MITRDEFDSKVTAKACGIVGDYADTAELLDWDHVRLAIDVTDPAAWKRVRTYEHLGFHVVSFVGSFEGKLSSSYAVTPRIGTDEEIADLRRRAGGIFSHSRFHTDPFFSAEQVSRIHEAMVDELVRKDELLFTGPAGAPHGFIGASRKEDESVEVELIAALDANPGSAELTLCGMNRLFYQPFVRTKTELSNPPACRLYERVGMKLVKTEAILTWSRP